MAILEVKIMDSKEAIVAEKYPIVWLRYLYLKPGQVLVVKVDDFNEDRSLSDAMKSIGAKKEWSHITDELWFMKPEMKPEKKNGWFNF
jgi:hypothetical protein